MLHLIVQQATKTSKMLTCVAKIIKMFISKLSKDELHNKSTANLQQIVQVEFDLSRRNTLVWCYGTVAAAFGEGTCVQCCPPTTCHNSAQIYGVSTIQPREWLACVRSQLHYDMVATQSTVTRRNLSTILGTSAGLCTNMPKCLCAPDPGVWAYSVLQPFAAEIKGDATREREEMGCMEGKREIGERKGRRP